MLKSNLSAAVALSLLTACGGGGTAPSLSSSDFLFTFARQDNVDVAATSGAVTTESFAILIDGDEQSAIVDIDGVRTLLPNRSGNTFSSADGSVVVTVRSSLTGGPAADETFFINGRDTSGAADKVFVHVDGFDKGDLRAGGTATYNGVVETFDAAGNTGSGTITLIADFDVANNGLSGTIDGGYIPAPTARFIIAPTDVPPNAVQFVSTLSSADVTVTDSRIVGQLFGGASADQFSGSFGITTAAGSVVGVYDAVE